MIDLHDKALLPRSIEIGFHPNLRDIEYGMPACSPNLVAGINQLEWIQRWVTRLVIDIRHLPCEERLQRRHLRADLITAFKIFTGLLNVDPNLFFFSLPLDVALEGAPKRYSKARRRGSAFWVRIMKYWNKLSASNVTAPSVNIFKKMMEKIWIEVFPHLPHWLKLPNALYHPLTVTISICYPTLCSVNVVSSGPLWTTFYHYKS